MKTAAIASIFVALLSWSGDAVAADVSGLGTDVRAGAFAGVHYRLPLAAGSGRVKPRLSFTVAPMLSGRAADGSLRMRVGDGLSLAAAGPRAGQLFLGGVPVASFARQKGSIDKANAANLSTGAWIGIGVAAAVVVGGLIFVDALNDASE